MIRSTNSGMTATKYIRSARSSLVCMVAMFGLTRTVAIPFSRLRSGIVEFASLTDLQGSRAEHEHPAGLPWQVCAIHGDESLPQFGDIWISVFQAEGDEVVPQLRFIAPISLRKSSNRNVVS